MIADRLRTHPHVVRHTSSAALVLIGAIALSNWVLAPHVSYLHAMQKLGAALDHVAAEKGRLDGVLATKVRQWQSLRREWTEYEEGVFSVDSAQTFLGGLLPLVEETGCTVVLAECAGQGKVSPTADPNMSPVLEVYHPGLVAAGQPDQVAALLQRLQDHRPRVWIDSCRCDFSNGGSGLVECNLVLALYVGQDRRVPGGP